MKKKIMAILLFLSFFIVSINNVKADIDITCGSEKCPDMDFSIVQLTSSNTGTSGTYKSYADYYKSYYQSEAACIKTKNGCTSLTSQYNFSMKWNVDTDFSASSTNNFNNLSEGIGTSASYTKAGTYAFLVKSENAKVENTYMNRDRTEYIIYVSVKSNSTIGSVTAKKIKDVSGNKIAETKVSELTYVLKDIWPTYVNGQYVDFYLTNDIVGDYADLTKPITYQVTYPGSTYDGMIIDATGKLKSLDYYGNGNMVTFTLYKGETFIIRKGTMNQSSLTEGEKIIIAPYLNIEGYTPTITANGGSVNQLSGNAREITIGYYDNYANYTWTYSNASVPETGININIMPYGIIALLVIIIIVLVVLIGITKGNKDKKKKKTTKRKKQQK